MATKKHPERVNEVLRPKFGIPGILGQSDRVVQAFGPWRGFLLMVLAIACCAGVTGTTAVLLAKLFLR
jgi:hypothetical protein